MIKRHLIFTICILLIGCMTADLYAQKKGGKGGKPARSSAAPKKNHAAKPGGVKKQTAVKAGPRKGKQVYFSRKNAVIVKPGNKHIIQVLPGGYRTIVHNKTKYYYHAGYYYRPQGAKWIMVAPSSGLIISALPPGHTRIVFGAYPYYYYNGIYYRQNKNFYRVVSPPVGISVAVLPEYHVEEVSISGVHYYTYNGFLYSRTPDNYFVVAGRLGN